MAIKFASILAALGMGSTTEAVTEAHLEAADAKIAQLETDKVAADLKAEQAATALKTAQDEQAKTATALEASQKHAATLAEWKKNQEAIDGRDSDDSNKLDDDKPEAKESWELVAAATIARTKKSLGEK